MSDPKSRPIHLAVGLLLLAGLAAACGAPPHRPGSTVDVGDAGRNTEKSVGDQDLVKKLEIHNVRSRRSADQRLDVEFELHNRMQYGLEVDWTMLWFDASGFQIETPLEYRTEHLDRRESRTISVSAPSPLACAWQLKVEKPGR